MAQSKRAERHAAKKPARRSQASSAASAKSTESPKLRAFYVELAGNLDKLSAFIVDPEAVAKSAGLSEEERELLFSGDGVRIYASLRPGLMEQFVKQQPAGSSAGEAAQAAAPAPSPPQPLPVPQGYPGAWSLPWPYGYGYGYGSAAYQQPYQASAYQAPAAPYQQPAYPPSAYESPAAATPMLANPAPQPSRAEQDR